tara:strand:- start:29009 stop:29221 length:213 start_codon:yes stop_codon:yes gene_type:complete
MCLICIEFEKEKLTLKEAWRNFSEMSQTLEPEHKKEIANMLMDAAIYGDEEIDQDTWHFIFHGVLLNEEN